MQILYVLGVMIALAGTIAAVSFTTSRDEELVAEANILSGNMLVYRNAVQAFASANPAFTGTVPDASLALPAWYRRISDVQNFVAGGRAFVYVTATQGQVAHELIKNQRARNTLLIGTNRGGVLVHPIDGTTAVTLPAGVPNGAVVYTTP